MTQRIYGTRNKMSFLNMPNVVTMPVVSMPAFIPIFPAAV